MDKPDLTSRLNSPVTFQPYTGAIPKIVPLIGDGRVFAGGDIILDKLVEALTPNRQRQTNQKAIDGWGQYFYLADLCLNFEDLFLIQTNSGFLTGIKGVVEEEGKYYVAVDAKSVKAAIIEGTEKYFKGQFRENESVVYLSMDGQIKKGKAQNVILFPYDGESIEYTADQSIAIKAKLIKMKEVINGKNMNPDEIIEGENVIHYAWANYSAETVASLVKRLKDGFNFEGKDYHFDKMMGLFLPPITSDGKGHGRALYVDRLGGRSRLCGNGDLGYGNSRVVGVDNRYAKGVAKK